MFLTVSSPGLTDGSTTHAGTVSSTTMDRLMFLRSALLLIKAIGLSTHEVGSQPESMSGSSKLHQPPKSINSFF